jgi:hypothetical protein
MRRGWVAMGSILLVVFALVLYLPLPVSTQGTVSSSHPLEVSPPAVPSSSAAPLTVSWTGGANGTWVEAIPCQGSTCTTAAAAGGGTPDPETPRAAAGYGDSGSVVLYLAPNESLWILTNSSVPLSLSISYNETPLLSLLWDLLGLLGAGLALSGLFLSRRRSGSSGHPLQEYPVPQAYSPLGVRCAHCGQERIPYGETHCPRCGRVLTPEVRPPGKALFVYSPQPAAVWRTLETLHPDPTKVLAFTGDDPAFLKSQFHMDGAVICVWRHPPTPASLERDPADREGLLKELERHFRDVPGGVVVIHGVPELLAHGGFEPFEATVFRAAASAREYGGILLLGVVAGTLDGSQVARLERNLTRI